MLKEEGNWGASFKVGAPDKSQLGTDTYTEYLERAGFYYSLGEFNLEGPMVESVNPCLDKNWKWTETRERPIVPYTRKGDSVYAICPAWPGKILNLERPVTTPKTQVRMPGFSRPLTWRPNANGLVIDVPQMSAGEIPCRNAWVFKLTGLSL